MASVLPDSRLETIQWLEARIANWATNATAIGLTTTQVSALLTLVGNARMAYNASQTARAASKAATTTFYTNTDLMRDTGADLIKTIKAFAATTGNDNVYALAQVPLPAEPTPAGPPGQPTDIAVTLTPAGSLTLTWKAEDAAPSSGAYFVVSRRLAGDTTFSIVGDAGEKTFTDQTIPLGTPSASYIITPRRGTQVGPASTQINVQFGVGGADAQGGGATLALAA